MSHIRYGISDIVISDIVEMPKYIDVYDRHGNIIGSSELYFIEKEDENIKTYKGEENE